MRQDKKNLMAKNAFALYLRMFIQLIIGFYTSRLILEVLGVEDYGIYNVVGSFVVLFTFLQGSLTQGIQRFLTFELGKNDLEKVKKVFCTSINIFTIFAIIIVLILGIIGIWGLDYFLNIPAERLVTARFVYFFSIITLFFQLISTPYNALIIAHEDIKSFAYIDLLYTISNFIIIVVLKYSSSQNALLLYSFFVMFVAVVIRFIYWFFCRKHYNEAEYEFYFDKNLFVEIVIFSGWITLSSISELLKRQGINILLNNIFGVIANAALGVANQVNGFVNRFASNLQTAYIPQLVKSYAEGNTTLTVSIVSSGAKMCCVLLMFFAIPLSLEANYILSIWLKQVPTNTAVLLKMILLETVIRSMTYSMNSVIRATGKIKTYEITLNIIQLISFVLCVLCTYYFRYIILPFIILIIFALISNAYMIYYCSRVLCFSISNYVNKVCINCSIMAILATLISYWVQSFYGEGLFRFVLVTMTSSSTMLMCLFIFVLSSKEKKVLFNLIKKKI